MIDYENKYEVVVLTRESGEIDDIIEENLTFNKALKLAKEYSEQDSASIYAVMGVFVEFSSVERPRPKAKVTKRVLVE